MLDWAKSIDPDGKVAKTVELLSQSNRILDDMLFKEGNLPTGEQTSIRTGLPTSYYRLINQGVPKSKSTKAQITENAAILTARSEVDVDEAELNGNVNAYRMDEAKAFVESMSQAQAQTLIYGSAANPEEYVGFANRYNDLSATNAQNIISAGGSGADNTSIWLVNWGENKVFGVFPKGSQAGLSHEDLGMGDAFDASDNRFRAYMDEWKWKNGLVVKDWREVVRIPNIDVSDLVAKATTQAITAATAIDKLMARAIDHLPNGPGDKAAFYVNRTVASHLRIMAMDRSTGAVTIEPAVNQWGDTIHELRFLGIPVRLVDRIINAEAVVA
jgi:Arc/MetJ family transcription regulator